MPCAKTLIYRNEFTAALAMLLECEEFCQDEDSMRARIRIERALLHLNRSVHKGQGRVADPRAKQCDTKKSQ
jgi:hypothetical protein